jgi:hypothetical protein
MIGETQQDVKDRQRRVEQKNTLLLRERERLRRERHTHILIGVITLACLLAVVIPIVILVTQFIVRGK